MDWLSFVIREACLDRNAASGSRPMLLANRQPFWRRTIGVFFTPSQNWLILDDNMLQFIEMIDGLSQRLITSGKGLEMAAKILAKAS